MCPPGDYIADVSEGITRPEDLPAPRLERHTRNYPRRRCPSCGHGARRYGIAHRFYLVRGGHNWAIWRDQAAAALLAASRHVPPGSHA